MRVRLDSDLLRSLIDAQGGVPRLVDRWNEVEPDESPDRSTVYRWINGTSLPKTDSDYLHLCSLLDIDPFALATTAGNDVEAVADEVLRVMQFDTPATSTFHFLRSFMGRQLQWPPRDIARVHFARDWHTKDFTHDPNVRANYYPRILLQGTASEVPQVFHFAFRHESAFLGRWLEYGFVRSYGTLINLQHIDGRTDHMSISSREEPVPVETWFGPGPVQFRVASLHSFSLRLETRDSDRGKAVRFPA